MDLKNINKVYFLGIGGIGMSALARYFLYNGVKVSGYDKTPSELTDTLISEGISIHFDDIPELIPDDINLAVYTPAIPKTLKEFQSLKNSDITLLKRAEVLGLLSKNIPTIAIAGTHGKTTVSCILAHILNTAGLNFSAFLGGISVNYNSNFITNGNPEYIIVEADEYDRSFLHLNPYISVVTAIDPDHLDIYENNETMVNAFASFVNKTIADGKLILNKSLNLNHNYNGKLLYYHHSKTSDIYADNVIVENGKYYADIKGIFSGEKINMGLPGLHNIDNALAAAAVAYSLGIDKKFVFEALNTFKGIKRRFEIGYNDGNKAYIDDYAHHPEEIKACLSAARELFPDKRILGVFQPHLYSRTRDLYKGFAQSLSMLDELLMLDIYPAREEPIPGISSEMILENAELKNKSKVEKNELIDCLKNKEFDVLITMGAGDIDRFVKPIINMLHNKMN